MNHPGDIKKDDPANQDESHILNEHYDINRIIPASGKKLLPLSFAQQRIWLQEQLLPETPNNICGTVLIKGNVKIDALQRVLDTIVERHEILRTTYSVVKGEPFQTVNPPRPVMIIHNDLRNCPEDERDLVIRHYIDDESGKLFDLSRDLMLRPVLIRLTDTEYVFLIIMHYISADNSSIKIFFKELSVLYGSFDEDRPSPLNTLPVQYADFACWKRRRMSDDVLQSMLSYWQKHLEGSPSLLELPACKPRPSVQNLKAAGHTVVLPADLVTSLKYLCEQECVSMFVMLMAAFKTLLFRYTGQGDLCVGTFTANREWPETKGLIGFFVNALVLRTDISDGPGFRTLLKREIEVARGAFAHYDMPFEKLVEVLNPQRDTGHTPLFQVAMVLEESETMAYELPAVKFQLLGSETSVSLYDLLLVASDSEGEMRLSFIYRDDIFDATTIQNMAGNFRTLLQGIVSDPDDSVLTLPILSGAEMEKIIVEW
ncbi:MAG: condensation domain-containing protein, partial [Nitrospirota bacterium]